MAPVGVGTHGIGLSATTTARPLESWPVTIRLGSGKKEVILDAGDAIGAESDEETDSEEEEYSKQDGSDFSLPHGPWLKLSEALF